MPRKLTTNDFINKGKKIHKNKYDYTQVEYKNSHTKVEIICLKHGCFLQKPNNHLQGQGCPLCNKSCKIDQKEFIKRAKVIHGSKYLYDNIGYKNDRTKIKIECIKHGDFLQTPNNHLQGSGCPKCSMEKSSRKRSYTFEEFQNNCKLVHGDKYDYSQVKYKNTYSFVDILCRDHGVFSQRAGSHLRGVGCPYCSSNTRLTNIEFISKSQNSHNYKYSYEKSNYQNSNTKVIITCKYHGDFLQKPHNHINGHGCPKCKSFISKPETQLSEYVEELGYKIDTTVRNVIKPYELDIYIPELNKAIEFNGTYWHYDHSNPKCKPKGYHAMKSNLCREKGIKLLHIREDLWKGNIKSMKKVVADFLAK